MPLEIQRAIRVYTEKFSALFCLSSISAAPERPTMASPAVDFARSNQPRFVDELKNLLRIPSISTLEEHKSDVQKAADFVASELRRIGMNNVEIIPTKGHPLLYADWLHAPGKPTVLMYAHYDVQPPDPLNEWKSPPFVDKDAYALKATEAEAKQSWTLPPERNDNIYARGAVDDKGQLWMEVKALESLFQAHDGKLPINVKVIFEGEEEVGGESIAEYVRKQKAKLKADFALVCDTELFAPDLPTLCVGLRGLVYTEIEASGAKTDLHSGMYGGAAPNPFFALIEIISKLKDSKGKVLIPGFYSKVKAPSKDELKAWKRLPFNEEHYRKTEVGSKVLTGEPGYSVLYRTWARPTLEVHGMPGGFTAPGAKTVIPARAAAKVSMRLVPNQDPEDILKRYTAFVKKLTPKGIETKIKVWSKGPACVVGTDNRYIQAATEALHETFKKDTVFIRSGGSIPIVTDFQDVLKIPSVMMGFGLPDDNLHAPNEKFHIPNFHRGIETICLFFEKLGG
jgi:acetylornithine deacetylase/succinyl-diaminopimelate desuccinylase-like protein